MSLIAPFTQSQSQIVPCPSPTPRMYSTLLPTPKMYCTPLPTPKLYHAHQPLPVSTIPIPKIYRAHCRFQKCTAKITATISDAQSALCPLPTPKLYRALCKLQFTVSILNSISSQCAIISLIVSITQSQNVLCPSPSPKMYDAHHPLPKCTVPITHSPKSTMPIVDFVHCRLQKCLKMHQTQLLSKYTVPTPTIFCVIANSQTLQCTLRTPTIYCVSVLNSIIPQCAIMALIVPITHSNNVPRPTPKKYHAHRRLQKCTLPNVYKNLPFPLSTKNCTVYIANSQNVPDTSTTLKIYRAYCPLPQFTVSVLNSIILKCALDHVINLKNAEVAEFIPENSVFTRKHIHLVPLLM